MAKQTRPTLRQLRRQAQARGLSVRRQGGQWIRCDYSAATKCTHETPLHYSRDGESERRLLAGLLGYDTQDWPRWI